MAVDMHKRAPVNYRVDGEVVGRIFGPYEPTDEGNVYVPFTRYENPTAYRLDGVERPSFTRAVYSVLASRRASLA